MKIEFIENYLADAIETFSSYKTLAEKAMAQVSDEEFFASIDTEANSIAVIVKHIAGNLHSRWRDFLTTDGEKASRDRDREFEIEEDTRETLMAFWASGWNELFTNLKPLTVENFAQKVTIRGEPHSVVEAINRQLTHYAYHVGQIVFMAKHFRSTDWKSLSVPKNKSAEFNKRLAEQQAEGNAVSGRMGAVLDLSDENER